ncbi:MAG TPA: methyltransferase domain-containing protein [Fimbriimonadaceae bacterium]|nr:methyltransferase domain-containing protein [Fimbriimonadaceae bacterium]
MASFGPIAPYYDRLMAQVPYEMWAGYYRLLLAQSGASPETLLDVCCGTGTLAEVLTKDGFTVTGFDLSAPMIEVARRKAAESKLDIEYHVADAAKLDLDRTFDAAYSFFDSLNYIIEPERLQSAIKRVAAHLVPGSTFIFDINTAFAFENKMFDQQDMRRATKLKYKWVGDYDADTRLIQVHMDFWHEGEKFHETHVQRAYTDEELRAMLHAAGLQVERVFDSYTLDPPRKRSDRLHYVTLKEGG